MKTPWLLTAAASLTLLLSLAIGRQANAIPPDNTDELARQELARTSPAALSLTEQGDAARRAGHAKEAAELYRRAGDAAPLSPVPARAACRAALAAGDKPVARASCDRAFMMVSSPEDMRNRVGALMLPNPPPTMEELVSASFLADGTVRAAPARPWGYAARCDIARHLGDRDMLEACVADLVRVAPNHAETNRALALASARVPFAVWLGRLALVLALAGTLAHALLRRRRLARARPLPVAAVSCLLVGAATLALALAAARPAHAAEPPPDTTRLSQIKIDPARPELSVPSVKQQNANPMEFGYYLQDLIALAEAAGKSGDHQLEARYYRALAIAIPDRSLAYGRLCQALLAAGTDRRGAIASCRSALSREGATVEDYQRFARAVLGQPGAIPDADKRDLDAALAHLATQPGAEVALEQLRCEIALRSHDLPALEACSKALAAKAPNDGQTISFQWALALERHDRDGARRLIDRARAAGMTSEGLARMERATGGVGWRGRVRLAVWSLILAAASALVLGAIFRFGLLRPRRRAAAAAASGAQGQAQR
jgi:tetratricopeptide (TPR) repeat protein